MAFYNPLDYDEGEWDWILEELVYKFRTDTEKYTTGENYEYLVGNYGDAFDFTKTDYYDVRREFLDFLSEDGTYNSNSEFAIADFWDKEYQIALYKFRQSYLEEVLDVLDSDEFKMYIEDYEQWKSVYGSH